MNRVSASAFGKLMSLALAVLYIGYVYLSTLEGGPYVWFLAPLHRISGHFLIPALAFLLGYLTLLLPLAVIAPSFRRLWVVPQADPALPAPGEGRAAYSARAAAMEARTRRDPERQAFYRGQGRMAVLIGAVLLALVTGLLIVTGIFIWYLGLLGAFGVLGGLLQTATGGPSAFRSRNRKPTSSQ